MRGLMTYFGNIWGTEEERRVQVGVAASAADQALEAFQAARMPLEIVSGGSTPAAAFSHQIPGLTEIRSGPMYSTI